MGIIKLEVFHILHCNGFDYCFIVYNLCFIFDVSSVSRSQKAAKRKKQILQKAKTAIFS